MELLRNIKSVTAAHHGCVLTIGNFDGVHKGHNAVLAQVIKQAQILGLPSAVMVFEPQPAEVFRPKTAPARLTRWRDKYRLLQAAGIDRLLCLRFSNEFASLTAQAFIEDWLVQKLGVKYLVVGDDFRFGKGRQGSFSTLKQAGERFGFTVVDTASLRLGTQRISSTLIRQAIEQSDFERANTLLGRQYTISGKVVHGDKKGRTIGFPTVNILLRRCVSPVSGVYAVQVMFDGKTYAGVANAGTRPTVNGTRQQLEVHLFNFNGDLYGKELHVAFKQKIRDEQTFASFQALKQQIELDAQQAKSLLLA
ncbi:bifunctional riboflavin kinase/FAD synthetase [Saccharobesus litoralis]|uniref:Riboflavin biosynthesis protein n=1 Tax=Saccharobesus litoralis TaxID=2172099 RepID=A0A2S0VWI6_9ALTE|nr:bifunctional riboflavin kinase/FAD synthetase [Saccharobesus litoralis]AWB68543.1 bifunctional riboflavin kinase/FAD synthetase [Saccharobesus litoralis]